MINLIITAGHHNQDPGAKSATWGNENINTQLIRNTLAFYFKQNGVNVFYDQDDWTLGQVIYRAKRWAKECKGKVVAIDIHFNAFSNPSARGCEVVIDNNAIPEAYKIAADISKINSDVLGIPDRGVKTERQSHHSNLGYLDITPLSFVWEVAFLSNNADMKAFNEKYWLLCSNIYRYLISL